VKVAENMAFKNDLSEMIQQVDEKDRRETALDHLEIVKTSLKRWKFTIAAVLIYMTLFDGGFEVAFTLLTICVLGWYFSRSNACQMFYLYTFGERATGKIINLTASYGAKGTWLKGRVLYITYSFLEEKNKEEYIGKERFSEKDVQIDMPSSQEKRVVLYEKGNPKNSTIFLKDMNNLYNLRKELK
jgi:hypothetical protein